MSHPIDPTAKRILLEEETNAIAGLVASRIEPGRGFVLLLTHIDGADGSMACASNLDRASTVAVLQEYVDKRRASSAPAGEGPASPEDCPCCHKDLVPGEDTDRALVVAFLGGIAAFTHHMPTKAVLCERHGRLAAECAGAVLLMSVMSDEARRG